MRLLPQQFVAMFCAEMRYVDGCHGVGADHLQHVACNKTAQCFLGFEHGQRTLQARHIEHSEAAFIRCSATRGLAWIAHMDLHQSSMFIWAVLAENQPGKQLLNLVILHGIVRSEHKILSSNGGQHLLIGDLPTGGSSQGRMRGFFSSDTQ